VLIRHLHIYYPELVSGRTASHRRQLQGALASWAGKETLAWNPPFRRSVELPPS